MLKKHLTLLLFLCATCALHAANYLTFTAEADSSSFGIHSEWWNNPDVQYSLDDGQTWIKLQNDTLIPLHNKKKALLRGYNPQGISREFGEVTYFIMKGRIAASGSVMSLIDNVGESVIIPSDRCFLSLFTNCASLTQAPELPAVHLTEVCYAGMFINCENLKVAPKLPATQLADGCYSRMFWGCTNLTEAPELPATSLDKACYASMFKGCTSLTKAPELPATTLAEWCYSGMFDGCSNLKEAPKLPATDLAHACYYQMFSGCASLTKTPELPATTLANWCYFGMFENCTGLTEASQIPEDKNLYQPADEMYAGCTNLPETFQLIRQTSSPRLDTTVTPEDPFSTIKESSSNNYLTFTAESRHAQISIETIGKVEKRPNVQYSTDGGKKWKSLKSGEPIKLTHKGDKVLLRGYNPHGFSSRFNSYTRFVMTGRIAASGSVMSLIDGTGESKKIPGVYCFCNLFDSCASLTKAPELSASQLDEWCYFGMFHNCSNLTQAPELPATQTVKGCYNNMFRGCTSLTKAPKLPAMQLTKGCYFAMFDSCISLKKAPELPATIMVRECYGKMFNGCSNLKEAPILPATRLGVYAYYRMFAGCTQLKQAPSLPAIVSSQGCYEEMFEGCTSLKEAPQLPAPFLTKDCYKGMFKGCTSLTQIPALNATKLVDGCYTEMFVGCTSLKETPQLPEVSLNYRRIDQSRKGYKTQKNIVNLGNDTIHLNIKGINPMVKEIFTGTNFKLEDNGVMRVPNIKGEDRFLKCEGRAITNFTATPLGDDRFYLESIDIATLPTDKEVNLRLTYPEEELLAEVKIRISRPSFYLEINDSLVKVDTTSLMPSFNETDDVCFVVFDEDGKEMKVMYHNIIRVGSTPMGGVMIPTGNELSFYYKKWFISTSHIPPLEIYLHYKNEDGITWKKYFPFFRMK
ncbi:MAG: leucine-rich repeat protein [Paludibacteraceae bacterium]|nr:leucine-rich repeat protein [Paludibacteraceae bacterium]